MPSPVLIQRLPHAVIEVAALRAYNSGHMPVFLIFACAALGFGYAATKPEMREDGWRMNLAAWYSALFALAATVVVLALLGILPLH